MTKNISAEEKLLKIIKGNQAAKKIVKKPGLKFFINGILVILIVFLAGYLVLGLFNNKNKKKTPLVKKIEEKEQIQNKELVLDVKKDIFGPKAIEEQEPQNNPQDFDAELQDKISRQFVLVGVMSGNEAIIEDRFNNKTYFLHTNETVSGLKLKEINNDKVILDAGGREVELVL